MLRFPWILLIVAITFCGFSLQYTFHHLGVNTNTSELLSPDLPFQKNRFRWEKAFPQDAGSILFVVEAPTPEQTSIAANQLADLLNQKNELFEFVYIPDENRFFNQQGLLYLDANDLEELSGKLTDAQPFIGHLAENYSLHGLLEIIAKALDNKDNNLPTDLNPLLEKIDQSIVSLLSGENYFLSWQELLSISPSDSGNINRSIVSAKPKVDFNKLMPAEQALKFSHETANRIQSQIPGVNIRLTGEKALEQEELETLSNDTVHAGMVALALICFMLLFGLRSIKLVISTFVVLIMGLILTAGYAALAVGHLNVLSVAFAVLYIGLGVDFAIHICLRYRECKEHHLSNTAAIQDSIQTIGFSLFLCALTTSVGFFAFIPTDYAGVSELGLISGGGMFIGLLVSLTVLPALLKILPVNNPKHLKETILPDFICTFPFRHAFSIRILSIVLAIAASFILTQLSFDSDPVNLRNPASQSVLAFKDLLKSKTESPFALIALSESLDDAKIKASKLEVLPTVNKTITLDSFVADNQHEKLDIIDELSLVFGNQLEQFDRPLEHANTRQALLDLNDTINRALETDTKIASTELLQNLQLHTKTFVETADAEAKPEVFYNKLGESILGLFPYTIEKLRLSLTAYPFTLNNLPSYITKHWLSSDGIYKTMIEPEKDLSSDQNLKQFVFDVQSIDDTVTGLAVGDLESGKAVVKAFIQAFVGALIVIILILIIILRSFRNTLLVIWPLLLAGLLTGAVNVLLDNPFNFANIIAMPLLMGMGVDSGIHIMHRLNSGLKADEHLLQTSTARGVFFSSLTTLCSFTSLAFTAHAGIASMGLLLAVGITFTLVCTLIVLPAFSIKKESTLIVT